MKVALMLIVLLAIAVDLGSSKFYCGNPSSYQGKVVCDQSGRLCGECVSFVKTCTNDERTTAMWKPDGLVSAAKRIYGGEAIATFVGGKYPQSGSRHAAILESRVTAGLIVWDQWVGRPVNRRLILWNGAGLSNNGNSFSFINLMVR